MKQRNLDKRKHAEILKSAIKLFLKLGYSNTSMDAIAIAAKVTKQTVYSHYQSKNALFNEMVMTVCQKHAPSKSSLIGKNDTIEEALYKLGLGFLNMVTSKEGLAATRLVVAEAQRHPELAQCYYESGSRQMLNIVADFLEQKNRQGKLHIPNPLSAASYFFSMLKGNYYLRILLNIKPMPTSGAKEEHVRETVAIFMRIYSGIKPLNTVNVL
jgi:TetR/AcrR family transcriptional repressor of mexJK operon